MQPPLTTQAQVLPSFLCARSTLQVNSQGDHSMSIPAPWHLARVQHVVCQMKGQLSNESKEARAGFITPIFQLKLKS